MAGAPFLRVLVVLVVLHLLSPAEGMKKLAGLFKRPRNAAVASLVKNAKRISDNDRGWGGMEREKVMPPTIKFSDLTLQHKAGDGAHGTVNVALYGDKSVAVKMLTDEIIDGDDRELQIASDIRADDARENHIVPFLGHGKTNKGERFAVYELMDGDVGDLLQVGRKALKPGEKFKALPFRDRVNVALDTARAMKYVHRQQWVHRDLKWGNIMYKCGQAGKPVAAFVGDFGEGTRTTAKGLYVPRPEEKARSFVPQGSPAYLSPENIRGFAPESPQDLRPSDVYSFGLMLYELVYRTAAWEDVSSPMSIRRHVSKGDRPAVPAGTRMPGMEWLEQELLQLIQACWAQDPKKRPTFDDIADELQALYERAEGEGADGWKGNNEACTNATAAAAEPAAMKVTEAAADLEPVAGPAEKRQNTSREPRGGADKAKGRQSGAVPPTTVLRGTPKTY